MKYLAKSFHCKIIRKAFHLSRTMFSVNYNFIIVILAIVMIYSSEDFLSSYSLKYFLKNATIYNSRNKGNTFMM